LIMAPEMTGALAEVRIWGTKRSQRELHDERSQPLGLADVTKKSLQVEISSGGAGAAASGAGGDGGSLLPPPPADGLAAVGAG